jgi:ribosomal peptide maturation radical SAM protein 1
MDVVLITMPWDALHVPSLQLGILHAVLDRAGVSSRICQFNLAFMEHLAAAAPATRGQPITAEDYRLVATSFSGAGDWIFAIPPFRTPTPDQDQEFFAHLRSRGLGESIPLFCWMRDQAASFVEACADDVLAGAPRIVGFTTAFTQNVASLALALRLKQRAPALRVVFGGHNCDGAMGAALHRTFPWVDVVVRGEGEAVFPEVVAALLAGREPTERPGLCLRRDGASIAIPEARGTVRMDDVPLPRFDAYFAALERASFRDQIAPEVTLAYESARGCWWGEKSHCKFCGISEIDIAFRSRSADRVYDDLVALAATYRRTEINVVDYILDLRYLRELAPRLRDSGIDFDIFYETKANLRRDQLVAMREAGIRRIQPGVESLSTPLLRLMRKGVTALQNLRLLKWCAELGIDVMWNVLYGMPGEPPEEFERMAALIPRVSHLQPPSSLVRLELDRFSPYHDDPARFGLEVLGPRRYYELVYPIDDRATLNDLAYTFEYRHADGRDPDGYVASLRAAVKQWMLRPPKSRTLVWSRGPGFITIVDERPGMPHARYTLDDTEAAIYLACDAGASAAQVRDALVARGLDAPELSEITEFLAELAAAGLVYEESGRYLALALARNPRRHADAESLGEPAPPPAMAPLVAIRRSASRP